MYNDLKGPFVQNRYGKRQFLHTNKVSARINLPKNPAIFPITKKHKKNSHNCPRISKIAHKTQNCNKKTYTINKKNIMHFTPAPTILHKYWSYVYTFFHLWSSIPHVHCLV